MKGVGEQVVMHRAHELGLTIYELYLKLYNGEAIVFDLISGGVKMKKDKLFRHSLIDSFNRRL